MSEPTATVWVTCPECATRLPCQDPANSRYFGCFKCRTYFTADPIAGTAGQLIYTFRAAAGPGPSLRLGALLDLGGYRCRLTGYQVRSEKLDRTAEWCEYQLRPADSAAGETPLDFPLQLAEYQGHWLVIRRAQNFPTTQNPRAEGAREWVEATSGRTYRLWHRYQPLVRAVQGEFDWNVLDDEELAIEEYISPPYLLGGEKPPHEKATWYLAEHLDTEAVATAFGLRVADLPASRDVGAAEPNQIENWPHLRRLLGWAVLLLTAMQVALTMWQPLSTSGQQFTIPEPAAGASSQMVVGSSLTVKGPTAVEVVMSIPELNNHWVEITASLVNEQTGRGYEATRSIEYYSGVESGEHWAEGSHEATALFGAVPAGRYHLNLYPTLDKGTGTVSLYLSIKQGVSLWSNYLIVLAVLGLLPLGTWWLYSGFERNRWQNSDFSPYETT